MKFIRMGICALIAFAVLAFGGVEAWSELVLEAGAVALLLAWVSIALRRGRLEVAWNGIYLPLLLAGALGMGQDLFVLTAYRYATHLELLRGTACCVVAFLASEAFRTSDERKNFAWFLVVFGFAVSLFAIVQHFAGNGRIYWLQTVPRGAAPFGPYVNANHFAGFVELTAPFGAALLLTRALRRDQFSLAVLLTAVPVAALVLTGSRGGIAGLAVELIVLFILARTATHAGAEQPGKTTAAMAVLALLVASLVLWLGVGRTIARFTTLMPVELALDRRSAIFGDTWRMFLAKPWIGNGLGTFATVYPQYQRAYDGGRLVEHAHNDYLELLGEMGVAGGFCAAAFIVLLLRCGFANLRGTRTRDAHFFYCAGMAACAGLLLHSLVDFNLHIPANALLFLTLACLTAASTDDSAPRSR